MFFQLFCRGGGKNKGLGSWNVTLFPLCAGWMLQQRSKTNSDGEVSQLVFGTLSTFFCCPIDRFKLELLAVFRLTKSPNFFFFLFVSLPPADHPTFHSISSYCFQTHGYIFFVSFDLEMTTRQPIPMFDIIFGHHLHISVFYEANVVTFVKIYLSFIANTLRPLLNIFYFPIER